MEVWRGFILTQSYLTPGKGLWNSKNASISGILVLSLALVTLRTLFFIESSRNFQIMMHLYYLYTKVIFSSIFPFVCGRDETKCIVCRVSRAWNLLWSFTLFTAKCLNLPAFYHSLIIWQYNISKSKLYFSTKLVYQFTIYWNWCVLTVDRLSNPWPLTSVISDLIY